MTAAKSEKMVKRTVLQFDPNCALTWFHVNALIAYLLAGDELDEFDDLLNGAGSIVTSRVKREDMVCWNHKFVYEDVLSQDFFVKLTQWLRETHLDELFLEFDQTKGDDALYVIRALDLSLQMTSNSGASALLAA